MSKKMVSWLPSPFRRCSAVIFLALVLVLASCASPQTTGSETIPPAGNGTIRGQVVGKGGPVAGAFVQLNHLSDEACAAANDQGIQEEAWYVGQSDADIELLKDCRDQFGRIQTDENGYYRFEGVPTGKFAIWIHWEQNEAPNVPLLAIPQPGYYFTTLSVEMVGTYRVDISMHEVSGGIYEIDVHIPAFDHPGEGELVIDFNW